MTEVNINKKINQIRSRLTPPSDLSKLLEWLVELLPRTLVKVLLKPINDIALVNEFKGEYESVGNNPKFNMTIFPAIAGWYYLEASLVRNSGNRNSSIQTSNYLNIENYNIPIPTSIRGSIREVFYLHPDTRYVSWNPMTAIGYFSQSEFILHKITTLESILRRFYRVASDLIRFSAILPENRLGLTWIGAVFNLETAYNQSAKLRIEKNLRSNYSTFIAQSDFLSLSNIKVLKRSVIRMPIKPKISLFMSLESPSASFLKDAVESICNQIYPYWELFIICDVSKHSEISAIVLEYESKNNKIKLLQSAIDMSIGEKLNQALSLQKNDYIAKIDQHSIITRHALFYIAQNINQNPGVDIIYTDNDTIDENNNKMNPQFKPDWNPDLFLTNNYFADLTVYKSQPVIKLGGFRSEFNHAIEYDLSLRCVRNNPHISITHIPRVLYHSRKFSTVNNSMDLIDDSKHRSGKLALESYFHDRDIIVNDGPARNFYHIKYPPPPSVLVSIIIPTRDQHKMLTNCINSIIEKTDYFNWELIVIDNQSEEIETQEYFEKIKNDIRIKVLKYNNPFNYSAINNFAVEHSKGEVLAFVNNDVEVISEVWLSEMVSHALRQGIGAVGAKLLYPDNTIQHAGVLLVGGMANHAHLHLNSNAPGYMWRAQLTQNYEAVTGACMIIRKDRFLEAGSFDEENLAVAFNDVDLCLRLREIGYRNVYCPASTLFHHESISRGVDDTPEKRFRFKKELNFMKKRWASKLYSDPSYNPNLSYTAGDFSFHWKDSNIKNF